MGNVRRSKRAPTEASIVAVGVECRVGWNLDGQWWWQCLDCVAALAGTCGAVVHSERDAFGATVAHCRDVHRARRVTVSFDVVSNPKMVQLALPIVATAGHKSRARPKS